MKIADFTQGRDNNFNLIRIVAAYAVLVSHSFALAIGTGDAEPFRHTLGMSIGSIAVDIFFLTSGFLVTASLLTRTSTIEFVWARVLRVVPALFVMIVLTVFVLGPFFTTLTWRTYFTDSAVYNYFFKSTTLIAGVGSHLPGVFENAAYRTVNGSLWTMPHEVRLYGMLAAIWLFLRVTPTFRAIAFKATIISGALLGGAFVILAHFNVIENSHPFARLFFMFFSGASFFILKDKIALSHVAFVTFATALLLASINPNIFFVVYTIALAYILFYVAYIPGGLIRQYNRLGDYSYGVYIYAFPVQQSTAALAPGLSVLSMVIISTIVTLLFAALSWHLLEKHALKQKGYCVKQTRRLLAFGLAASAARS